MLDHDVIAVLDVAVDHGIAMHLQDEAVGAAEERIDFEAFVLLGGVDRGAGSDGPQERQPLSGRAVIDEFGRDADEPIHAGEGGDRVMPMIERAAQNVGRFWNLG